MIRRRNDPALPPPSAPFSHLVEDPDYVHLSGLVASDLPGGAALVGDVAAETERVMTGIAALLETVGLELSDLVRVQVHLVELDEMPEMNRVYAKFFADGALPARTCTQSAKLADGCRVEITATARRREAS